MQFNDTMWPLSGFVYGVCMCVSGGCVGTYGFYSHLEMPLSYRHPTGMLILHWNCQYIVIFIAMETKLYKQQPKKIPETERLTQECSVSALWVKRAECFTAFLAVLFSLLFGLFSYPLCLRFRFILCTTTILFQPFHILTFHSAFCDPVFCPGGSLTHVDVLNGVTFFFCYFASFAPQGELPLLQPIKWGPSTVVGSNHDNGDHHIFSCSHLSPAPESLLPSTPAGCTAATGPKSTAFP